MKFAKCLSALFFASFLSLFSGCSGLFSGSLGYSVLLWSNSEHNVQDGAILKVYIKSNISQVYVVSFPKSKEKFEIPLWQITEPESKGKALRQQARFADFAHTYASVKLDGLPIREEAVNTSKQVYRLREGEIVRCLYRGTGAAVTNGHGNMSGEWLRVLTSTGTVGWCFSHNLELFEAGVDVSFNQNLEDSEPDEENSVAQEIENLASKKWYPENFAEMIKSRRINPEKMKLEYGFDFGIQTVKTETTVENGETVEIEVPIPASEIVLAGKAKYQDENESLEWNFSDITKNSKNEYEFKSSNLVMSVRGGSAVLQYMEGGKVKIINLVAISENVGALVQNEIERRQQELEAIFEAGPEFKSSSYGTIKFGIFDSLRWTGYRLLVPSVISRNAKDDVEVSIEYFIPNSLKSSFDGVLTMKFEGMENKINFFYKLTDTGLRLEDASQAAFRGDLVSARGSSPIVMFFEKK